MTSRIEVKLNKRIRISQEHTTAEVSVHVSGAQDHCFPYPLAAARYLADLGIHPRNAGKSLAALRQAMLMPLSAP